MGSTPTLPRHSVTGVTDRPMVAALTFCDNEMYQVFKTTITMKWQWWRSWWWQWWQMLFTLSSIL